MPNAPSARLTLRRLRECRKLLRYAISGCEAHTDEYTGPESADADRREHIAALRDLYRAAEERVRLQRGIDIT